LNRDIYLIPIYLQAELFNLQRPRKLRPDAVPTKFKYFAKHKRRHNKEIAPKLRRYV